MRIFSVFFIFISLTLQAQCDLEILGFDPVDLEMTLAVNGGDCGSPVDSIGEFILTLTFDPPIPPAQNPFGCFDASGNTNLLFPLDLPFVDIGEGLDETISTGDTLTFNIIEALPFGLGTSQCWQEAINSGGFDSCAVLSINQINDSACLDGACEGLGGFPYPDINPANNTIAFSLTDACGGLPPPPLIGGCTDTTAINFNPLAEFDDDTCEYIDLSLFYISVQYDCNPEDLSWIFTPEVKVSNWGNAVAESFCVDVFLNGETIPYATECFEISVSPDEVLLIELPTYAPELDGYTLPLTEISFFLSNVEGDFNQVNDGIAVSEVGILYPDDCYIEGCTDPEAINYNLDANIDDGSCEYDVLGCTDESANNFDPEATIDDGSCLYDVLGCTDINANNYNSEANVDDGSCTYDIFGCTDVFANNYNPEANVDDGSCTYDIFGCTDIEALNFNPQADVDDGSCEYECDDPPLYIPNVFTPNNDGVNDVWRVVTNSDCWREFHVSIFNRWGGCIWQTSDPDDFWMGEGSGATHYVPDGVYVYLVQGVGYDPNLWIDQTGHLTLFR
jgi:gliding motility-associated-like protein